MWLLVVVLILAFALWTLSLQPRGKQVPGPFRLPVIGTALSVLGRSSDQIFVETLKKHGPIASLKFGPRDMILLGTPELIHEAFIAKSEFTSDRARTWIATILDGMPENTYYDPMAFSKWERGGIVGSSGERWRQTRKMAFVNLLSKARIKITEPTLAQEISFFEGYLSQKAESGEPIDPTVDFPKLAMNIITQMAFSRRFNSWREATTEEDAFSERLAEQLRYIFYWFRPSNLELSLRFLDYLPNSGTPKFKESVSAVRAFLESVLKEREENLHQNLDESEQDFIDIMLRVRRDDAEYTDVDNRSIVSTMFDMLLAGTDTTSNSTAFLVRHLANDIELQKRVQKEIDGVVGAYRPVGLDDLPKLPLLDACVFEQMRLWPVAGSTLLHRTNTDITIGGYEVKKDSLVLGVVRNLLHDGNIYPEPEKFIPERWLNDTKLQKQAYFMPFGTGPRICVGRYLAEREARLIVANFVQKFSFEPTDGKPIPYEDVVLLTTQPKSYKLTIKSRIQ